MKLAIQVLRKEIDRLGGELFSQELDKFILKGTALQGDSHSERRLKMDEFVGNLMGGDYTGDPRAKDIEELFEAITLLAEHDSKGDCL